VPQQPTLADDPRRRFSGAASTYARHRPSYPAATVDWIVAKAGVTPGDRVADIGCGTGILTRLLAERGLCVVGLDPNHDMLAEARDAGSTVGYVRAEAAATGLGAASVALVTAAQAFHWFDLDPALFELRRVLRKGGHLAVLWNLRAESPFMSEYDALLRRYSDEYTVLEKWEATLARLRVHPRIQAPRQHEARNAQRLDLSGLIGRAWSSSYVRRGVKDRAGFDAALRGLFETHAQAGVVEFPYRTVAMVARVVDGPVPTRS
jgi:ubiquinone/menaquinone biosynthesis C-methylase UbiE